MTSYPLAFCPSHTLDFDTSPAFVLTLSHLHRPVIKDATMTGHTLLPRPSSFSLSFLRSWLAIPYPDTVGTELCYPQLGLFSSRVRDLLPAERNPCLHLEVSKCYSEVTGLMGFPLTSGGSTVWVPKGVLTFQEVIRDYQDGCWLGFTLCPQPGPLQYFSNGIFFFKSNSSHREIPTAPEYP